MKCRVLIAGAGPAGLGAALLLDTLGWTDIVVVERRSNEQGFDRGRAFNYQLEGRGIGLLERVGITAETLRRFGLPNDHFTLTTFAPDGKSKTMQPPILVPGRKTPYWMTRSRLLALLEKAMQPVIERGSVTVLYDHQFAGFEQQDGSWHACIRSGNDDERLLQPELVLGCDGLGSAVRRSLSEMSLVEAERLRRIEHPSMILYIYFLSL